MKSSKNNSKVFYVCFYSDLGMERKLITYPSVIPKIDYVVKKIKETGKEVLLVSQSMALSGKFNGRRERIDQLEVHKYFSSINVKNKILKKINIFIHWIKILIYLLTNVRKNDKLIVYNSLFNRWWLKVYSKVFRRKYIIEIEDVFSELSEKNKKYSKIEWEMFILADAHICINDLVFNKLPENKEKIISYGSYLLPKLYIKKEQSKCIKLVYAGVIEQEREAAFLAVKAAGLLPKSYSLDVLGFGTDHNIEVLKELITSVDNGDGRIKYCGMKNGREYYAHLQGCDIALSTHRYNNENIKSAENTFPSKILVYMANNLRVVAQKLDVLVNSKVGGELYYYDCPNPQEIAKAIMSIDINDNYDSRKTIAELDEKFGKELINILETV